MGIARHRLFAQDHEPAFLQSAQRLVIERRLAEKLGGRNRAGKMRNRLEQFRLTRSSPPQFLDISRGNLFRRGREQLLFPADLGATNHLWQETAHDRFDRAAVICAHPLPKLDQLFAQRRSIAQDRFDRPNAFGRAFRE